MMSSPEYSIGIVKNRFALNGIEEEVDPLELLKRHELETEARKKSKVIEKVTKTKETPKPKIIKQKASTEIMKQNVPIIENDYKNSDDISDYQHSNGNGRAASVHKSDSTPIERNSRRGLPRGVFVRGGGRGRATFNSRGKREFDRQSGSVRTGIKSIDKRDGSGSHNWGNPRDDIASLQTSFPTEEKVNQEPDGENNETVTEEEVEENINNIQEDAEKKELTLDEWKAMKTPRKQPTYNIRKAGEGEDLSLWKKMYALEKKIEIEGEEDECELGDFPQRVGRQKMLDIDIRFKDLRGVAVGRGRGLGRGGGSFQAGRGAQSPHQNLKENNTPLIPAPKVDDERDFPSLA